MKYSVLCGVSGHHDVDSIFKRLMECHFPRRIPSTEKKCKPRHCIVWSKYNKREQMYNIVKTVILLRMSMGVSKPTIQEKITEIM